MQNNANHSIFLGILSLILTIVITVGGAAFWLGGSIAATKASVDNNTKTLAALRTEMKAGRVARFVFCAYRQPSAHGRKIIIDNTHGGEKMTLCDYSSARCGDTAVLAEPKSRTADSIMTKFAPRLGGDEKRKVSPTGMPRKMEWLALFCILNSLT